METSAVLRRLLTYSVRSGSGSAFVPQFAALAQGIMHHTSRLYHQRWGALYRCVPFATGWEKSMFDRFTERARRVIFFARLEASKTRSASISTEHLLLGLMRENMYLLAEFPPGSDLAAIRSELFGDPQGESVPTSVDMPLTESAGRVLQRSQHERYSLKDDLVTCGHLLLAILDEEQSAAGTILKRYGVQREQVLTRLPDTAEEQGPPNPGILPNPDETDTL